MSAAIALYCVAAFIGTAGLSVALARLPGAFRLVYGASLAVSTAACVGALAQLLFAGGAVSTLSLPLGLPELGAHFRLDALAAFFLAVVNLGGAAASLYGLGYGRHEPSPARVLPFFPVFLAAMNLVVLADDAYSFLLSWEFMSLTSWAIVVAHHDVPANVRAGYLYLLMASFGTLCLLLAFGLLAGSNGTYAFAAIRAADPAPLIAGLALALALVGTGSKAGLVPLHVWLPLAHPAAPSHVSALLSGVMTKVGVYGFVRLAFDLIGEPSTWSSMIVLTLGGITSALGVLYALMQHDLKRLLAYHTVENIGIIFIGLGLAMAFQVNGMAWAAALALTAALFHVFNHSVFKSLLFFGAGAVLTATHERDMERLGGLIHRMPATAVAFLIGCAAISALPPLNGFVSEWLTFQAILVSPQVPQWGLKFLIPAVGALLALSAALAAACFVKAFGVTFLGRPRSPNAASRAGGRPLLARRDVLPRRALLPGRRAAGLRDRSSRAGRAQPGRRPHAGAGRCALAVDRADRREPQLLQRDDHPSLPRLFGRAHRDVHPSFRHARDKAQRDLGLRLPRRLSDHAVHELELRHADPARVRRNRVLRVRESGHAATRRNARGALPRQGVRSGLAPRLRTARAHGVEVSPAAQRACSSSPSGSTSR